MKVFRTWGLLGDLNMAVDVEMGNHLQEPALRLYNWAKPTLSLGKHQKRVRLNESYMSEMGIDCVVRPTGGRAVLHWDELTYSLVIPKSHILSKESVLGLYLIVSKCIEGALRKLGFDVSVERPNRKQFQRTHACFDSASAYEIKINGKKVVGSAQVRTERFILQHGSIVLKQHFEEYEKCLFLGTGQFLRMNAGALLDFGEVTLEDLCASLIKEFEVILGKHEEMALPFSLLRKAVLRRKEFVWKTNSCGNANWEH
ncbi:MAG: lipoate--protein ligase family protein [Thermotogae bacterium]|nr:MAG: lipoate--protein ligase family protein [Thermotogota bacterium]